MEVRTERKAVLWVGRHALVEIIEKLNEQQGLQMPVDEVSQRKEELYLKAVHQLKAVPEVLQCIESNYGKIPFALVSGSTRDSVIAR